MNGGESGVRSQPWLHKEMETGLDFIGPYLKQTKIKGGNENLGMKSLGNVSSVWNKPGNRQAEVYADS